MHRISLHLAVKENDVENHKWLDDIKFDDSCCKNENEKFMLKKQLIMNELQRISWIPKGIYILLYDKDTLVRTIGKKQTYHLYLKNRHISAELQVTEN